MSYRAGIGGTLANVLGVPRDPHIVCDGCGATRTIYSRRGVGAPAMWFIKRKPAPGWELVRQEDTRGWDYCPECKARRKAAQEVGP
jgi:hypothetical protein